MEEKILKDCGLSEDQTHVYLYLLKNGLSTAKNISTKTGTGRALVYKVLEQLINIGLAERRDNLGKIVHFLPSHPQKIKEFTEQKIKTLDHTTLLLNQIFGSLSSEYNLLFGKPNVQYSEGQEGLAHIYDDIIETGKDILLITSPVHKEPDNIKVLISKQIKRQIENNIHTKAITPATQLMRTKEEDEKELRERKVVATQDLNIPAQVIIYGDKVAITNFKEEIINVVIESKYIKETFEKMFEYIWNHGWYKQIS